MSSGRCCRMDAHSHTGTIRKIEVKTFASFVVDGINFSKCFLSFLSVRFVSHSHSYLLRIDLQIIVFSVARNGC